jgi:small subunit ribosomal protein S1
MTMEEERFDQLFEEKKTQHARLKPGDRVEALIVGISGEHVFLDVGDKSEGVLSAAELRDATGELTATVGERLQVYFLSSRGGESVFTTRLGSGQTSVRELEEAFAAGIPVEGTVSAEIKGGFAVMLAGQRCFCPYSQMDIRRVESAEDYLDKTFTFKIIEFGQQGKNILVSARAVLEEERQEQRQRLQEELREGMQISGTVTSLRDFGAFVDIGGVDGLIPIGELAWGQIERVEDVLERGQQVEVIVKNLDWERDRISLSLRETTPSPWEQASTRYPVGSVHQGRVVRLTPFGAFVTLEPGLDGLVHISKLGAGRKLNHPREVLESGQELTVQVEAVDAEQKRISLAPEDYQPPEKGRGREHKADYTPPPPREPVSMGTLGDLLSKAQQKKRKK